MGFFLLLCHAGLKEAFYKGSVTQLQFSIKTSIEALTLEMVLELSDSVYVAIRGEGEVEARCL